MRTFMILYRLYDVADEIDLDQAQALWVSRNKIASRLRLNRVSTRSITISNPPLLVELGSHDIKIGEETYFVDVKARIQDLGVIALIFFVELSEDITHSQYMDLIMATEDMPEESFRGFLDATVETIRPACSKPRISDFEEDFTVCYFQDPIPESWDIVPMLLKDRENVSEDTRQRALANRFSYGDDVCYMTWDCALVYDSTGSLDIPDLLEFANAQFLELRYYDGLLDNAVDRTYDVIEEANRDDGAGDRLKTYTKLREELMETMADVSSLTSTVSNALLVTEDIFYARVYTRYLELLKADVWQENIENKMLVLQRCYNMLNDEVVASHMERTGKYNTIMLAVCAALLLVIAAAVILK